jgi:2,6-dihydroxypseudooxynicotine hydrolase
MSADTATDATEIQMVLSRNSHRMFAAGIPPVEFDWAKEAQPTTWRAWYDHWTGRAQWYAALAEQAAQQDRRPTAAGHFMTAALCSHFAQFMIFEDWKNDANDRAAGYFHRAAPLLQPPASILYAKDPGSGIDGIPLTLSLPPGPGPHPCVLLIPGLEANKIEFQGYQRYFTSRGLAFACMEGPGQGELHDVTLTIPAYLSAVSAVVDLLQARPELDAQRIGLCGISLGGLLGSLAVANDPRFRAAAEVGGTFDTASRWQQASWISKRGSKHITRSATDAETEATVNTWTMFPVAHQVKCPFLVVHGDQDKMIPVEQVDLYRTRIPQAEVVVVPRGNHVCNNQAHYVRPLIADWFADQLSA